MLQIWPPGCITCIVTFPWIALLALLLVLSWYLQKAESHQLYLQNLPQLERLGPIDRTPGTPGSDKNDH